MDTSVFPLSQHQKASSGVGEQRYSLQPSGCGDTSLTDRHADCSSSFQGVYRSVVFEQPLRAVPFKAGLTQF